MIEAIKNIFAVIVVGAIALFFFAKSANEEREKQHEADYAAEMAWKDPLIQNCENAVRGIADAQTIKFGNLFGEKSFDIDKTDSGYLYRVQASDATTANQIVTVLCYTNKNGQVIRVVPQGR
jgi:hypothetical protein